MTVHSPPPSRRPGVAERWRPTAAHLRAAAVAVACLTIAVLARRPDLVVIGLPFALITAWSTWARPATTPTLTDRLGHTTLREGDATTWRADVIAPGAEHVAAYMAPEPWVDMRPRQGTTTVMIGDEAAQLTMQVRSVRWGRRTLDPVRLTASSPFGAFESSMSTAHTLLATLPVPAAFDANAPMRVRAGLVGLARSSQVGDGGEFSSLRPFAVGDRMRRINWPRSLRTDALQVNATWADQDTHIAIIVDASDDFGRSGGIDGVASSLDTTVRAIGAIAEHHIRRGDRVSVRSFGTVRQLAIPPGSGHAHLRRILDALTRVRPGNDALTARRPVTRAVPVTGAALTVMLSPLVTRDALDRAIEIGRHGLPIVVIDTLPREIVTDGDAYTRLAWRIRLLDRRREIRRAGQTGIPVVQWQGPGSLDQFLRDAARRAAAPRMRTG